MSDPPTPRGDSSDDDTAGHAAAGESRKRTRPSSQNPSAFPTCAQLISVSPLLYAHLTERAIKDAQAVLHEDTNHSVASSYTSTSSKFSRLLGNFNPSAVEFVPSFLRRDEPTPLAPSGLVAEEKPVNGKCFTPLKTVREERGIFAERGCIRS